MRTYTRLLEWALLLCVVFILAVMVMLKMRAYQADIEFGAFQYFVGQLRATMQISRLQHVTHSNAASAVTGEEPVTPAPRNPFLLLPVLPPGYIGEKSLAQAESSVPSGVWFYDPACPCIGYRVQFRDEFASISGSPFILFVISYAEGQIPDFLSPAEPYRWHGQLVE